MLQIFLGFWGVSAVIASLFLWSAFCMAQRTDDDEYPEPVQGLREEARQAHA